MLSEPGHYQILPLIPRLGTVCLQSFAEPSASAGTSGAVPCPGLGLCRPWVPQVTEAAPNLQNSVGWVLSLGFRLCFLLTASSWLLHNISHWRNLWVIWAGASLPRELVGDLCLMNSSKCSNENHNETILMSRGELLGTE